MLEQNRHIVFKFRFECIQLKFIRREAIHKVYLFAYFSISYHIHFFDIILVMGQHRHLYFFEKN